MNGAEARAPEGSWVPTLTMELSRMWHQAAINVARPIASRDYAWPLRPSAVTIFGKR
jgi:hypothetical protein